MRVGRVGGQMRRQLLLERVGNAEFLNRSHDAKMQLLLPYSDSLQEWRGKGGYQQPSGFLLHDASDKMDKKSKTKQGASATKPANPTTSAYAEGVRQNQRFEAETAINFRTKSGYNLDEHQLHPQFLSWPKLHSTPSFEAVIVGSGWPVGIG